MKKQILRHLSNLPGWRTRRKIVVIESDDWGSIRMPSLQVFDTLQKAGLDLTSGDSFRYNQNDTLANENDLEALFCTLNSINIKFGKKPVITAISLTANPDFEKIEACDYDHYHHEPFTSTLERYGYTSAFNLWKQGISEHLFIPEFHGREHLNVAQWMRDLQRGDEDTLKAFDYGCWGFKPKSGKTYQAAFYLDKPDDLMFQENVIKEGLDLFRNLHGYQASAFVPPNGPINNNLHKTAAEYGIKYISTSKIQDESLGAGNTKRKLHWLGQQNKWEQRYLTRNVFFEPSAEGKDWVSSCLKEIKIAFQWRKPAVISSHRVNYIGGLHEDNRTKGLKALKELLFSICKRWPDVEFMTTTELGNLINGKTNDKEH